MINIHPIYNVPPPLPKKKKKNYQFFSIDTPIWRNCFNVPPSWKYLGLDFHVEQFCRTLGQHPNENWTCILGFLKWQLLSMLLEHVIFITSW